MADAEGYALITDPYGGVKESSTFKCVHCQFLVHVHFGSGIERGYCFLCDAPTCGKPRCNDGCYPFMKRIEEAATGFTKLWSGAMTDRSLQWQMNLNT